MIGHPPLRRAAPTEPGVGTNTQMRHSLKVHPRGGGGGGVVGGVGGSGKMFR